MAHLESSSLEFKIDDAAGSLTTVSASINNASVQGVLNLLRDTGFGDTAHTFVPGIAGATVPFNCMVDSTTSAIFGPLIGKKTSITKQFGLKDGIAWYTGSVWPGDVQISGSTDELQVLSGTLTFEGAVTYTSAEPT